MSLAVQIEVQHDLFMRFYHVFKTVGSRDELLRQYDLFEREGADLPWHFYIELEEGVIQDAFERLCPTDTNPFSPSYRIKL